MRRTHIWILGLVVSCAAVAGGVAAAAPDGPPPKPGRDAGLQNAVDSIGIGARAHGLVNKTPPSSPAGAVTDNFTVLGHNGLGSQDATGDVWVHGDFAYLGTWSEPCTGRGVKIVDVSDLSKPRMIGAVAATPGTSAEDVVVRHVETDAFEGDLLAVGLQRCGHQKALDKKRFGPEFWDVTNPYRPRKLSFLGLTVGGGGVHELDLFQRGDNVYAVLATPFSEFFDPFGGGDFRIVDVTDPTAPFEVGQWGAGDHGLTAGPWDGIGSFGATFAHSARASADGKKAYVSYWDIGVLTFDITDVTDPTLVGQTQFPAGSDGDAHSVAEYTAGGKTYLLQNDEDYDPTSPATITYSGGSGLGNTSPSGLLIAPLTAPVVLAANEGCNAADYPAGTTGKIAVVRTPFPYFDSPPGTDEPDCENAVQESAAAAAGAAAVVHSFEATATSPQWWDVGDAGIPVLFTDPATTAGMIAAGTATLTPGEPSWGFIRVFDAATGAQVGLFDGGPGDVLNVHTFPPPPGFWSVHNNEISGDRAYAAWYSGGIVAIDLADPTDPEMVGQFVPPGAESSSAALPSGIPNVWGVAIREEASGPPTIFASDMIGGLWIVRPTGDAAP